MLGMAISRLFSAPALYDVIERVTGSATSTPRRWTKCSKRFILAVVLLVAVWLTCLLVKRTNHRITRESVVQVTWNMTEQDVISFIGVPPGNYALLPLTREDERIVNELIASVELPDSRPTVRVWVSNTGALVVVFDEQGKVVYKCFKAF
jgi:hypothetical protein